MHIKDFFHANLTLQCSWNLKTGEEPNNPAAFHKILFLSLTTPFFRLSLVTNICGNWTLSSYKITKRYPGLRRQVFRKRLIRTKRRWSSPDNVVSDNNRKYHWSAELPEYVQMEKISVCLFWFESFRRNIIIYALGNNYEWPAILTMCKWAERAPSKPVCRVRFPVGSYRRTKAPTACQPRARR